MKRIGEKAGFVKVYRDLAETDFWLDERFTKGQAWVDLLLLAQGVSNVEWEGGKLKNFRAGTVYMSIENLSERWKWNRKTVMSFLKRLAKEGKATSVSFRNHGTQITIENWSYYQNNPKTMDMELDILTPCPGHEGADKEKSLSKPWETSDFEQDEVCPKDSITDIYPNSKSGHNKEGIKNNKEVYYVRSEAEIKPDPRSATAPLDGGGSAGKERIPAEYRDKFDSYEAYYRWRNQ